MSLDSRRLTIALAALGVAAVAMTAIAVPRRTTVPSMEAPVTSGPAVTPTPLPAASPSTVARAAAVTEVATHRPAPATTPETVLYGEAGMRVEIDPETGVLGPARAAPSSLERSEAEAAALNRSSEGLQEVVLPDGSVMVDLQGRFQEYVVMEIGPDGKRRMRCVQQPAAAAREVELK